MRHPLFFVLLAAACAREPDPLDLTEPLSADEARAGVVTNPEALFGGISAEGQVGDLKIYNDRVRFIVQSVRQGSFYFQEGGVIIDADLVRQPGEPGGDMVDEWAGMYGLGRVVRPTAIEVVADGSDGLAAIIRVEGEEAAMGLFVGVFEDPNVVVDLGLSFSTDFILRPGSWLLEVQTTITASQDAVFAPGDLLMASLDGAYPWDPGVGLETPAEDTRRFTGFIGKRNEGALALVPEPGRTAVAGASGLLGDIAKLAAMEADSVELSAGQSHVYTRYYGVTPDTAVLAEAIYTLDGVPTQVVDDVVSAPDGPVAGAWVHVYADEELVGLAITGSDGSFHAAAPADATMRVLATGQSGALQLDAGAGRGSYSPYAHEVVKARVLDSMGREGVGPAQGRGMADKAQPLVLAEPGQLTVRSADGAPFEVRAVRIEGVPHDPQLLPRRQGDADAVAWATDGEVVLPLLPGDYRVLVHRGIRFERHEEAVTVVAGGQLTVQADLELAYAHPGYLLGDPHQHAAPSPDAETSMEVRLAVSAAVGLQIHFGTDHDHVADYGPLLKPLGLDEHLATVIAEEASSVRRGHINAYPLEVQPGLPNHGAWLWWVDIPDTTEQMIAAIRDLHDEPVVLQVNHPTSPGLASLARWSLDGILRPSFWSDDFDAIEVNNAGNTKDFMAFYLDCINHGLLAAPVGVSDAHAPTSGGIGLNTTFIGMGDGLADSTPDNLRAAMGARHTVVSRGPFLDLSIAPGSTVVGAQQLQVEALAPSWIQVDRLVLLRDGQVVEQVDGVSAVFELDPEIDASYVVLAEGDTAMGGVWGSTTPWAMSSAILVDTAGDGWQAPLGDFVIP